MTLIDQFPTPVGKLHVQAPTKHRLSVDDKNMFASGDFLVKRPETERHKSIIRIVPSTMRHLLYPRLLVGALDSDILAHVSSMTVLLSLGPCITELAELATKKTPKDPFS